MYWDMLLAIGAGLLATWLTLVIALLLVRPKGGLLTEAVRLLPDLIRLLRRLAADKSLPRGVRIRLGALMVYLALPIDLIPDFLPVIGYARRRHHRRLHPALRRTPGRHRRRTRPLARH